MMATTHGFTGLAVAAGVAVVTPELAVPAAVGGIVGGLVPDIDVLGIHRKSLHFPVYYTVAAALACAIAIAVPTAGTVALAVALVGAAVHCLSDIVGGIPAPDPWAVDSADKAVYLHPQGRWIRPRRWVRYDGAPEDFFLGAALAVPGLVVFAGPIRWLAVLGLLVSAVYTVLRRPIGRRLAARTNP